MPQDRSTPLVDLDAASFELGVSPLAVEALAAAGYVASSAGPGGSPTFSPADLKAFVARNAENGAAASLLARALAPPPDFQPEELVALLDSRAEHMARRMLKMFMSVFPGAEGWSPQAQDRFVTDARKRFEAILAVAAFGTAADEALHGDLYAIGASAARTNTDLPQLLVLLRISRDLVVQNAVDLAESDGRHGGFALSLLLTRILPTMDTLADALAAGYWETVSRA